MMDFCNLEDDSICLANQYIDYSLLLNNSQAIYINPDDVNSFICAPEKIIGLPFSS